MDAIGHSGSGLTIEQYAAHKGFEVARLRRGCVHAGRNPYNGEPAVAFPYLDLKGQATRTKFRTPTNTVWDDRRQVPLILYGLWLLPRIAPNRPIILVEGESDVHAGWHHATVALGLPGCSAWKPGWAKLLDGHPLYVWREPDLGGTTMTAKLAADLPDAKCIEPVGVKDLAELHLSAGAGFAAALLTLMDTAVPIRDAVIPALKPSQGIRVWREQPRGDRPDRDDLDVERARSVPLDRLMSRLGFELKRRGRELAMHCPFHEDHRPSLLISPSKGTWYCHPCGTGGDAIEFIRRWRGLTFPDAVRAVVG